MALHCVGNYEQNLYHDSYFYSVFWDDENHKLEHVQVGATAYAGGSVRTPLTDDQTVWEEAKDYVNALKNRVSSDVRKFKSDRLRKARSELKKHGVHTAFSRSVSVEDLEDIAAIFSNRVRNKFKKAMRENVLSWKPGGKFETPLSPNQMAHVRRPMRDIYGRENQLCHNRSTAALRAPLHILRGFGAK